VAKHVERTPFSGGLNRENVGRSIAAAGKLPVLNGSRHLDELKNAVGIMVNAPEMQKQISADDSRAAGQEVER
jgi:hypothetical protein